MKTQRRWFRRNLGPAVLLPAFLSCTVCLGASPSSPAPLTRPNAFEEPTLLTAGVFAKDSGPRQLLYKFQRTSSKSGTTNHVLREFSYPDGSPAARERLVYEGNQLVAYEEHKFQSGEHGSAVIRPDPKHPGQHRIFFEFTSGLGADAKKTTDSEKLESDTLVGDMLSPYMALHWDPLAKGTPLKFRYIVVPRMETVGFKLVKAGETTWLGKPALRIRMEPTSVVIAQLVDPLFFIVEKDLPHRVLEYTGRTTPLIKDGNKWKELDAVTVFDWQ